MNTMHTYSISMHCIELTARALLHIGRVLSQENFVWIPSENLRRMLMLRRSLDNLDVLVDLHSSQLAVSSQSARSQLAIILQKACVCLNRTLIEL